MHVNTTLCCSWTTNKLREFGWKFQKRNGRTRVSVPRETAKFEYDGADKDKYSRYAKARQDSVNYTVYIICSLKKRRVVAVNRKGLVLHDAILTTLENWFAFPFLVATTNQLGAVIWKYQNQFEFVFSSCARLCVTSCSRERQNSHRFFIGMSVAISTR